MTAVKHAVVVEDSGFPGLRVADMKRNMQVCKDMEFLCQGGKISQQHPADPAAADAGAAQVETGIKITPENKTVPTFVFFAYFAVHQGDFPGGFEIPFYGDHVSLFTLLMTVSTIMYTHINNQMMASSQQMPGMKTMMYMMPIMFLGIFNNYASGLSYYYLLANLITFAQMWLIRRTIDEKKILAQIELNKKKPAKKSNFQKKLEDAAKKRGYKPPKKK